MAQKIIALDAMGGDYGPSVTVAAANMALEEIPGIELVLVGDREQLSTELQKHNLQQDRWVRVQHASEVVEMGDLPVVALKKKKDSSMRVAINLVKEGEVQACVSAGNTGALMATGKFVLKTIRGISRPAICTILPGIHGHTHMLDLGANPDCTPEILLEFALMGSILAQSVEGIESPSVGLLNIGSEEIKGNESIKRASQLIRGTRLNYHGFVEGDDVFRGTVNVIVTDGFVGNVSLKTGEGLAALVSHVLRSEFERNWLTRLAGFCALPVLTALKRRLDPRRHNGASLLGLNGIVIKSHGSADTSSFFNAIKIAAIEIENKVPQRISAEIENYFSQAEEAVT
ncbi:MAG: Phosphate:acyl-ACP acyltransferase PlsX (EC 2.3.1.n2) [Olavius algarvensis Gamma 3 endosymbiont]|nr:MAG: Phosphate:acyl-ACP acyltransferase PlsX (EC 2.3.1.n2) [Olavius algarvensis Gamma 3 endosymbiont]